MPIHFCTRFPCPICNSSTLPTNVFLKEPLTFEPNVESIITEAELRELAAKEANGFKVRYGEFK